jgi:hypothetical protein
MEIRRVTHQRASLDEFYAELALLGPENVYSKVGAMMQELLRHLREREGPTVWGVTSHATLNLVPGDDYRLPTLVSIACDGERFRIQRLVRPDAPRTRHAYVTDQASEMLEAVDMVVLGLREALRPASPGDRHA